MTLQRFQSIVLKIGNQIPVRHYLWLNYPEDVQLMGIQFEGGIPQLSVRERSCDCGKKSCKTCVHREYMRERRPKIADSRTQLRKELTEAGFKWHAGFDCWTIERSES